MLTSLPSPISSATVPLQPGLAVPMAFSLQACSLPAHPLGLLLPLAFLFLCLGLGWGPRIKTSGDVTEGPYGKSGAVQRGEKSTDISLQVDLAQPPVSFALECPVALGIQSPVSPAHTHTHTCTCRAENLEGQKQKISIPSLRILPSSLLLTPSPLPISPQVFEIPRSTLEPMYVFILHNREEKACRGVRKGGCTGTG